METLNRSEEYCNTMFVSSHSNSFIRTIHYVLGDEVSHSGVCLPGARSFMVTVKIYDVGDVMSGEFERG